MDDDWNIDENDFNSEFLIPYFLYFTQTQI